MELQQITLITFGYWDHDFLKILRQNVSRELNTAIHIKEGHLDVSDFYDVTRRQYNANDLLKYIKTHFSTNDTKTLGLFNIDLFIPIFTYIFGQAYLGGRCGIASIFRLSNERYGMEADVKLLLERSSKEVIHELGHMLGLIHCFNTDCVMHSGSYVEDIDQKSCSLCDVCRTRL